ncbi:MAG: hypothetical protein RR501_09440, partial [Cloacibacillus sp.]
TVWRPTEQLFRHEQMEVFLVPGCFHICPKGSEHRIINTGGSDLVLLRLLPSGNIYNTVNY